MFAAMSAAALALAGGYSVSAQDYDKSGYCPITKGMTLEYVNYDADDLHRTMTSRGTAPSPRA